MKKGKLIFIVVFVVCSFLTGRLFAAYELEKPNWCVIDCGLEGTIGTGSYALDCSIGPLGPVNWQPAPPTGTIVESGFYHIWDPMLSVSPTSLDFGTTGERLTITVKNTGGGPLSWNAGGYPGWLTLSKTSGNLGAGSSENVTATVSRAGKSPGTYTGTISFTSIVGGSQNVSVSMTVPQPSPDPVLSVSPTSLDFGTTGVSLTITVRNAGGGTLDWSASESLDWLGLSKTSGSLGGGISENVTATVSRSAKSPGTYTGTVSFTSIVGGSQNVSVSMTVPEPAPALSVNPTSLDFGTTGVSLTITVRNAGGGVLDWNASENIDWLSLNKTSGSLGGGSSESVTATVSRTGKSPGTYNGTISFTSNGGSQNVSVSMTVPQPDPALSVSPTSLDFGTTGVSLTITVRNSGGGTLNWNASESLDWLSLSKTSGSLGGGISENVTATVSRTGKSQGTYSGTISFTSSYGNQNVSVSMTVPDTTPPIISNLRVNPTIANAEVVLTITFTVSETLQSNPLVTVAGNAAIISGKVGNDYAYIYDVQGIEGQGRNKPVNVSAADLAGNIGSASTTVALDFTAPNCEADKWGVWHSTDIVITLTAIDEEEEASGLAIARYNWDTQASETVGTAYNNGDTIVLSTETGEDGKELHLYARDNAGNIKKWNKTYYLDKTGPICSADKSGVWHRQDITITLTCSAGTGYIKTAMYNWDTPASETVGTPYFNGKELTLNTEVNGRTLYLYVKSSVDREKTWSGNYYLDKTDPICSADKGGTWHREDINIVLVATDEGNEASGIKVARYKWDTPASETGGVVYGNGNTITLTTETNGRALYIYVKDNAGREKTWSGTYYLDKTPPSNCLISINGGDEYTNTTSAALTLSASDGDIGSGVSKMQFSSDGVKWSSEEDYATSRSWMLTEGDGGKAVYVQYKDNVGNWSAIISDTIILDTISPIVKLLVEKARILPDGEIVGVIPDTGMEARFSKVMDGISVSEGLKLVALRDNLNKAINEEVSLNFEWDGSTKTARMNLKTGELKKNYLYRLGVTDKVRDLAGNTVKGEGELIFRTIMDHTKKNAVVKVSNERLIVTLEANALKEDGYLVINTEPLTYQFEINPEVINVANEKSIANRWYPIEGCLWEIKACKKSGNWIKDNFGSEVKITFPYDEKGVVGNTAIPLSEDTLMAFWLNEEDSNWVKVPGSRVDRENNVVITGEVPKFSVFSLLGTALYDLRDAYAYPVPWKPNDGKDETGTEEGGITFTRLYTEAVIRIYTISGELVKEYEYKPTYSGEWKWDVKTSNGEKVFSGVYIYYIESEKERKTGKLVIIR